jgi:hypothetical protein
MATRSQFGFSNKAHVKAHWKDDCRLVDLSRSDGT